MVSTDLPKTEMIHYRFVQPTDNGKRGQDSTQLTVTAAFGSKQISFVRSEARACTFPANNLHIGWNSYDKIPGGVPPVTLRSGYEEGPRLDSRISGMGAHPDHQRRHIPMATVPKNGLICLTSFTDEKFSGLQRAAPTTEVFKTRLPAAANAGINPCRSTSCHLVRDRFRRDLAKGQKILWANERLDNLHAQITKQVGEGTRQLQEGILDYVDKISTCFQKKNSYSLGQPSSMSGSCLVELTQGKQRREEKEEEEETRSNSSREVKGDNNGEKATGSQVRERTSGQYVKEERRKEKERNKTKKKEEEGEAKAEENEEEKKERAERGESDGEDINNGTKNEAVPLRYQHQRSLQPQQESRQHKDNQSIQAQNEEGEMQTDFQYRIDSDLTVASAKSSPNPNHEPYSDSLRAKVGTLKLASRRMTCPNINFNLSSVVRPDT